MVTLSGKGPMLLIARELAWRKAAGGWALVAAHLPKEKNHTADALTRLAAPLQQRAEMPSEVQSAQRRESMPLRTFFSL